MSPFKGFILGLVTGCAIGGAVTAMYARREHLDLDVRLKAIEEYVIEQSRQ